MSVHFEERSGVLPCKTPWGNWSQTIEEVFIEVNVPHGMSGKEVKCHLGYKLIELHDCILYLLSPVSCTSTVNDLGISVADEGTWTLMMCLICIVLMKMNREGEYCADAWLQDHMQRKLTLERFHRGGDTMKFSPISGAEISGNAADGGPAFYSLQK
uniref:CS domain-containing protein n=1 Tax=Hucho hucho TaxID=62062 RepID=A0A4W5K835_9TELE